MTTNPMAVQQADAAVYSQQFAYDYLIDGGAIGTINFRSYKGALPAGARVIGYNVNITRAFTAIAGNTTVAGIEATNDVQTVADCNTFGVGQQYFPAMSQAASFGTVDAVGFASPSLYTVTEIKTTVPRMPRFTVGVHPITDGAATLTVEYVKD